jgi:molybdopterin-guanine dinucleotide biosynthesis protein A
VSATALVAVLAGGASRRMGAAKPLAPLGGRPLIAWPLAAAAAAGLRAVVVAKAATPLPPVDVEVWLEPDAPQHPLTGLVHALERSGSAVVAVGCDQPWLPPELLTRLATAAGCAAPLAGGALQPFPARYPPGALDALRAGRDAQAPVRRVLASLDPEPLAVADPRVVAGVNTPDALAAAERSLASRP